MISPDPISVRTAQPQDRGRLANLIHFSTNVHRHLDWQAPLDWFGHSPYLVAERNDKIISTLVCPPDPPEVAWIRLFAASTEITTGEAWDHLWPAALDSLAHQQECHIAAIPIQRWFRQLLEHNQFTHAHNIVMLTWESGFKLPSANHPPVSIRPMRPEDLPSICDVDCAAFGFVWRNSLESLKIAFNQAIIATVAEDGDGIVGYQISTPTPIGGHLARLAVLPNVQHKGIGYTIVRDLLIQFEQRKVWRVTVNTQEDNVASLKLYEKAGFSRSGEEYPVYLYKPNRNN